jgi:plasmid maintenance system antidote protein VapI
MMNNKKLSDAEILKNVLDKTRHTPYSLAKEMGISSPGLYQIIKGEQKLTNNVISRIINKIPEINESFLKYGQGSVLIYKTSAESEELKELKEIITNMGVQLQKIAEEL